MKNFFYVYIYLDIRKPGRYSYDSISFLYEPFYVGKGHGNRYSDFKSHNNFCYNKIKKIQLTNEVVSILVRSNLSEKDSLDMEKQLIKEVGRQNLKTGPLTNFTDGGEGVSGYKHSQESIQKMSKSHIGQSAWNKGKKSSKESILKMINSKTGKKLNLSEGRKEILRNNFLGDKNPAKRCEVRNKHKKENLSLDTRKKMSHSGSNHPMYGKYGKDNPLFGTKRTDVSNRLLENNPMKDFQVRQKVSGQNNGNSKLTEDQVRQILRLISSGYKTRNLVELFNVSNVTILNIKNKKTWKNIEVENV